MSNKNLHILILEDDQVDITNLKRSFKKTGLSHQLSIVNNGLEGLDFLNKTENNRPDLLLLDLNMPKMNGHEFLEVLRDDPNLASLPVYIMTTSNDHFDRTLAFKKNVAGYILKPITASDFCQLLTTLNNFWQLNELV